MSVKRRKRIQKLLVALILLGVPSWLVCLQAQRYRRDHALVQAIKNAKKLFAQYPEPSKESLDNVIHEVIQLLKQGADPNVCDRAAAPDGLWGALMSRLAPSLQNNSDSPGVPALLLLLDRPDFANASWSGWTSDTKMTHQLLQAFVDKGVDVNTKHPKNGMTPLIQAIDQGYIASAILLVEKGAEVNVRSDNGTIPLILACSQPESWRSALQYSGRHPHTSVVDKALLQVASEIDEIVLVKALLAHGADIHARDTVGYTSLHKPEANPRLLKVLIQAGADVNARDKHGCPPIFTTGHFSPVSIEVLLDAGANINIRGSEGMTPLMVAVDYDDLKNVQMLLQRGADATLKDKNGKTALDYADGDAEIIHLLRKAGAK